MKLTEQEREDLEEAKNKLGQALLVFKDIYGHRSRMFGRLRSLYQNAKTDLEMSERS